VNFEEHDPNPIGFLQILRRWFGVHVQSRPAKALAVEADLAHSSRLDSITVHVATAVHAETYDPNLLERARIHWRVGDWNSITNLDLHVLAQHPDRAKLALVVASAWQQRNDQAAARRFVLMAREWGCDKKLVAQLLVAGVYNTLGRAAALNRDESRALEYFRAAVSGAGGDLKSAAQSRSLRELSQLGLTIDARPVSKSVPNELAAATDATHYAPQPVEDSNFPIFVHSLWRAGSTYLFNVFRRSDGYWAYQEPLHEKILGAMDEPDILLDATNESLSHLRHPKIGKPYFYELHQTHQAWCELPKKRMVLDDYFSRTSLGPAGDYLRSIISAANGRPVIQECRTSNRIGLIKNTIGGVHLYLWRNPWDQWWSIKVHSYFDSVLCIILGVEIAPEAIVNLRKLVRHQEFHSDDINEEISYFAHHRLSARESYLVFYTIWCLAYIEGADNADVVIDIDQLSASPEYRENIYIQLEACGVSGIDFSDCDVPRLYFDRSDEDFFIPLETKIHALLCESGCSEKLVDEIRLLRQEGRVAQSEITQEFLIRDLHRARAVALDL
jgi:hypothetical protein